jgi:hypothetical protein
MAAMVVAFGVFNPNGNPFGFACFLRPGSVRGRTALLFILLAKYLHNSPFCGHGKRPAILMISAAGSGRLAINAHANSPLPTSNARSASREPGLPILVAPDLFFGYNGCRCLST